MMEKKQPMHDTPIMSVEDERGAAISRLLAEAEKHLLTPDEAAKFLQTPDEVAEFNRRVEIITKVLLSVAEVFKSVGVELSRSKDISKPPVVRS